MDNINVKTVISDTRKKRQELETKIRDLIAEFEKETGLELEDIVIEKQSITVYPGYVRFINFKFYV